MFQLDLVIANTKYKKVFYALVLQTINSNVSGDQNQTIS